MSAATMAEEGLADTCEGIVRDYLAHRGYEARAADGWSCDCGDAPIAAMDADEAVLVAVISAYKEGSATMPELSVGAAEFAMMRRVCLLYLADHGDVDAQRQEPWGQAMPPTAAATPVAGPSRPRRRWGISPSATRRPTGRTASSHSARFGLRREERRSLPTGIGLTHERCEARLALVTTAC